MSTSVIPRIRRRLSMTALAGILAVAGVALTGSVAAAASAPSSPIGVTPSYVQGTSQATVSWQAPVDNSPASTYVVRSTPGGLTCTTTALSCVVKALVPGTTYDFVVTAHNADGTGPASNPSSNITVTSLPSAVRGLTAHYTQGATSFEVTWSAPTSGYPAPNYLVSLNGATPAVTSATSYSYSGLGIGSTYQVTVIASNSVGEGPSATASSVTITELPSAPRSVSVALINNASAATVSWSVPAIGYPAAFTYTVTSSPGGLTCATTTTSCTVSGLTLGTTYTFSVVARNTAGAGPAAVSGNVVATPAPTAPGSPVFAAPGANVNAVTLSWSPSPNCSECVYSVYYAGKVVGSTGGTSLRLHGLDWDTSYTFSIVATNGTGESSAASLPSAPVVPWRTILRAGETLSRGQFLYSPNKAYHLSVTASGYLVIERGTTVIWERGAGRGRRLVVTGSGDLILTGVGGWVWTSHTKAPRGFYVTMGNNGRLEIYHAGRVLWRS
jgi:hypothetical protein